MHWINFAWKVELAGIVVLIYGLVIFLRALTHLKKEFKIPIWIVFISLVMNVALGIMIGVFIVLEIDSESFLWIIHPVLGLFAAYLLVLGAKKFFVAIKRE
jgi:uncharacterized membrane protein YfcA